MGQRLAEGMAWHFLFMWFFIDQRYPLRPLHCNFRENGGISFPTANRLAEAIHVVLHDLHLSKKPLPRRKFNGAQQFAYYLNHRDGLRVPYFTGLSIYRPVQFAWLTTLLLGGYPMARFIHFWLTIGYCLFFLVHVAQVVRAGWNNFRAMVTGYEVVTESETSCAVCHVADTLAKEPVA